MFCIYLRKNSDLCHLQHKLIGFYNRDEKCLQRGTDWVFKQSGLRFVFKGSNLNLPSLLILSYESIDPTKSTSPRNVIYCFLIQVPVPFLFVTVIQ